ncbi:MAG: 6-carboxytetrahydropterin synthase QueD [Candidatus Methylacidiphilales bacterium]
MHVTLTREFTFDAAQSIPNFPEGHKCRRVHGHGFILRVSVAGEVSPDTGLLYDHGEIAAVVKPIVEELDHTYLNDIPGLELPTMENMCAWFWARLQPLLPGLVEVQLFETSRAWCSYRGQ